MKILVSTNMTQGQRPDDFCFATEGEPVRFSIIDTGCSHSDEECGCGRAMFGIGSLKGTTTMAVADYPADRSRFEDIVRNGIIASGATGDDASDAADELILAAMPFDIGDVVERRGHVIKLRKRGIGDVNDAR